MTTMNDLRQALAQLPHRRITKCVFAERRDTAENPAWAAVWACLAAELAELEAEEARLLRDALNSTCLPEDDAAEDGVA